jgi:Flp pilus assembly CpaE family ATPase
MPNSVTLRETVLDTASRVREASDAGRPVLESAPDSEASAAIRTLAEAVVARRAGAIRKALTVL